MATRKKEDAPVDIESKADRFRRLAQPRVNKVIEALRVLGNCGDSARYEYTESEVERMLEAIDAAYESMRDKYRGGATAEDFHF